MRSSSSVVVVAAAATTAFGLRVARAFLAAARLLRVAAAFFAVARGLRVFEAFLAAVRDFRVFAAFFAADFLEADFDLAMFPSELLTSNPPDHTLTCLPTNSTIRPNMSPLFDRSGELPAWRSMSTYSSAISPPALR